MGVANGHVSRRLVKGLFDIRDGKLYLFAKPRNGDFDQYRKAWLDPKGGPPRQPSGVSAADPVQTEASAHLEGPHP